MWIIDVPVAVQMTDLMHHQRAVADGGAFDENPALQRQRDAIARLAVSHRRSKWKDVNLGAVLPGWSRVPAAETWLARASAQRREALQSQFDEFLQAQKQVKSSELTDPRKKKLFDRFQAWARKSVTSERAAK